MKLSAAMKFVDNEFRLHVDEALFAKVFDRYKGRQGACDFYTDLVGEFNIRFPNIGCTLEEALEDFDKLKSAGSSLQRGKTFHKFEENDLPKISSNFLSTSTLGYKSSNHFHWEKRSYARSTAKPSGRQAWSEPIHRHHAFRCLFGLGYKKINNTSLAAALRMSFGVAGQFRPTAAKTIYNRFASGEAVLDMCSGWGDRLSGFLASDAEEYWGFDPNINVHDGYKMQCHMLNPEKKAKLHYGAFETAKLPQDYFKVAFSSPPYFNLETYSDDKTQSIIKYPNLDDWIDNFLVELAVNALGSLKRGGHLLINIQDYKAGKKEFFMATRLMAKMRDLGYVEGRHIGYGLRARVGAGHGGKAKESLTYVEPIWHWIKQ